jgi:site-specific recombinase XerD
MAKTTEFLLPEERQYNRTDYTALRAYCMKIPLSRIAELYYCEDSEPVQIGLERFLIGMRDHLIDRAAENNPGFAETLKVARQTGHLSPKAIDILVQAADLPKPVPSPADKTSNWFRPLTVRTLRAEGIETLQDLSALIQERGPTWWRAVPRIGRGRAQVISAWLRANASQLGELPTLPAHVERQSNLVVLNPELGQVAPLGTFVLPPELDGRNGINRSPHFSFIEADTDLEALDCYLSKFNNRPHTLRAYHRELERFVLWCALVAKKPLSSLLASDCEAYRRFLENPAANFCGKRYPRTSKLWRPFTTERMQPSSVKASLQVLRGAFEYLVKVRHLGGTPWEVIDDPVVIQDVHAIQIDKALSTEAWDALVDTLQHRGEVHDNVQDRVALAAILLMGDSGLRRHEAATAMRHKLTRSRTSADVWMLEVIGKRSKKRDVPVSPRTVDALRNHWNDLGLDFTQPLELPLLSPVIIPNTDASQNKHVDNLPKGYRSSSFYDLVKAAIKRVRRDLMALGQGDVLCDWTVEDIEQLKSTSPHAFRHTFGTQAVENDMPVTVVQSIMGHTDSATTSIYIREAEKRIAAAASKFYGARKKK